MMIEVMIDTVTEDQELGHMKTEETITINQDTKSMMKRTTVGIMGLTTAETKIGLINTTMVANVRLDMKGIEAEIIIVEKTGVEEATLSIRASFLKT